MNPENRREAQEFQPIEIPKIYSLIQEGASDSELLAQLNEDFDIYNLEACALAIQEIVNRPGGRDLLTQIENSELRNMVARLASFPTDNVPMLAVEYSLGITRGPEVVDFNDFEALYQESLKHSVIPKGTTKEKFIEMFYAEARNLNSYIDDSLDREMFTAHPTFGSDEPTYLELLGAKEILRLRTIPKPRMLLLGSYGKFSAEEFERYAKKINPNSEVIVIDISEKSIKAIKTVEGIATVQADARQLPFADESFDHIYTNQLFFFLGTKRDDEGKFYMRMHDAEEIQAEFEWKIQDIADEAFRALKSGGSFVPVERTYGIYAGAAQSVGFPPDLLEDLMNQMGNEVTTCASEAGFKSTYLLKKRLAYTFRKDRTSAELSENGFAYYNHPLSVMPEYQGLGTRFIKP